MGDTIDAGWATYERLATADLATLNDLEVGLVAIGGLRTEVNNGGFHQYFFNSSGDLAENAGEWARRKGQPDLADVVEQAMHLVGEPYPNDWQDRRQRILSLPGHAFDALDRRYLLLEVALDLDVLMDDLAESSFWIVLERRIISELRDSGRMEFADFWCDGIWPTGYQLARPTPTITGSIHLGESGQDRWEFTLTPGVDRAEQAAGEKSWEPFLPAADTTGWLAADADTQTLRIDLTRSEPLGEPVEVHPKTGRIRPLKRSSKRTE